MAIRVIACDEQFAVAALDGDGRVGLTPIDRGDQRRVIGLA